MPDRSMSTASDKWARQPSFERPPLVETATSVQFDEIELMRNAHLALFWSEHLRSEYPQLSDAEAITPQHERFSESAGEPPRFPRIHFGTVPVASRLQARSNDEFLMAQIQNGRLVFNWRRLVGGDYPRWDATFSRFQDLVGRFRDFLAREGLGDIRPNQWEVVYVNHFEKDRDWKSSVDWNRMLPGLVGLPRATSGTKLESTMIADRWEIEPRAGRLYMELNHAFRVGTNSGEEILALQLLARGPVADGSLDGAFEGLRIGRAAIVNSFVAVTSDEAQRNWGRI